MKVRRPAVAGMFYPGQREALEREVSRCVGSARAPHRAFGAIVPHAGYVYSGSVAGAVYSRVEIPSRVVLLGPNHTGLGTAASVDPNDAWATPLGEVQLDVELRERFLARSPSAALDSAAHSREHSLEVQLPFLQVLRPGISFLPVCIGAPSLELCLEIGHACAELAADPENPVLVLASSDMNHYESRDIGNRKNALALARIEALDPEGLFRTVLEEDVSMCGFLPVTALLFAARKANTRKAEIAALSDSGDETGDVSSVVGYAGVIID